MSWEQLQDIEREWRAMSEAVRTTPPAACPNDGTPLQDVGDGRLHCPFDGWQYPRDWFDGHPLTT